MKEMEIYTVDIPNYFYNNRFFKKKADEYSSNPEKLKSELKRGGAIFSRKIKNYIKEYQEDIYKNKDIVKNLLLSKFIFCKFHNLKFWEMIKDMQLVLISLISLWKSNKNLKINPNVHLKNLKLKILI